MAELIRAYGVTRDGKWAPDDAAWLMQEFTPILTRVFDELGWGALEMFVVTASLEDSLRGLIASDAHSVCTEPE